MAENGNKRRVYLVEDTTNTYVQGQMSGSLSLNDELIDVSDKIDTWARYISGKKAWSASVGVNLDNSATAKQIKFLEALRVGDVILKKETITGAQMMAILEGRDPDQEEYYGVKGQRDTSIEAPAKHIHMTSEPVTLPEADAESDTEPQQTEDAGSTADSTPTQE